jgi:DNA-directed RNA polymerase subunit RPC12/RpoP
MPGSFGVQEEKVMTREELKEHCEKQIEMCEMWAIAKGEEPSGNVYEEHKLILELLEQESKTGHWIKITPSGIYICSECEQNVLTGNIDAYHYCHHCGIKMINVPDKNDGKLSEIPTGSESEE